MTRWNAANSGAGNKMGTLADAWETPNPRAGLIAGCWITAIWIATCCAAIVLLGACGATASSATSSTPVAISENAEAEGVVIAPAPTASATTPADPTRTPSTHVGQPKVVATSSDPVESADAADRADRVAAAHRQPAPSADIRDVDFRNGFTHVSTGFTDPIAVEITDGRSLNGEFGDDEFFAYFVAPPVFGDLDGDGAEEAAMVVTWNGGGSGFFDSVVVFSIVEDAHDEGGHEVVLRARRTYGDRAFGGVSRIEIVDQRLIVDAFVDGDGSCCPNTVAREAWWLRTNDPDTSPIDTSPIDTALIIVAKGDPVRWLSSQAAGASELADLAEVTFLPGGSSALLNFWLGTASHSLRFDAAAGQHLSLTTTSGPSPVVVSLVHAELNTSIEVTLSSSSGFAGELPHGGMWRLDVVYAVDAGAEHDPSPGQAGALLSITDSPSVRERFGVFDAVVRHVVVEQDPAITATDSRPDFSSLDAELDARVEQWFNTSLDEWVSYAEDSLPLPRDDGGEFSSFHTITLVTDDLVSVRFGEYEYLCCRPYPNLRQRSLIVDVTNGRMLDDADIVDLNRLGEIEDVWLSAMAASDEWELDPADWFGGRDEPSWSSLTLVPGGLNFGTDRRGAIHPIDTFVSFAELGDLVRPEIVRQVATGTVAHGF